MKKAVGLIMSMWIFALSSSAAPMIKMIKIDRGLSEEAKSCIECHSEQHPGVVQDWVKSRHAHANVTCIDCHEQPADSPMASQSCPGAKKKFPKLHLSVLVSPNTCKRCHPNEHADFAVSGHQRAALQILPSATFAKLRFYHEGQQKNKAFAEKHPELVSAADENGCQQCHGVKIELDPITKTPTAETWPNPGMGNIYPDGGIGNCTACHTRHRFSIAEARKPDACASCHLGPDHPDIEIFENSKHGHIWKTSGDDYNFDAAPDAWEPGDYRAPTCAVCHMSGIGDLKTTHNVSRRLYWNLWAPRSMPRNGGEQAMKDVEPGINKTSPGHELAYDQVKVATTGHPDGAKAARNEMKEVCSSCHTGRHTESFFKQADKQVHLYNLAYYDPAKEMLDELTEKGLMKDNIWKDEFFVGYYHLWHHEGRRMRQGALMQAPDYSHWHGSWEVMQRLADLQMIFEERTGQKHSSDYDEKGDALEKRIEEYKKSKNIKSHK